MKLTDILNYLSLKINNSLNAYCCSCTITWIIKRVIINIIESITIKFININNFVFKNQIFNQKSFLIYYFYKIKFNLYILRLWSSLEKLITNHSLYLQNNMCDCSEICSCILINKADLIILNIRFTNWTYICWKQNKVFRENSLLCCYVSKVFWSCLN